MFNIVQNPPLDHAWNVAPLVKCGFFLRIFAFKFKTNILSNVFSNGKQPFKCSISIFYNYQYVIHFINNILHKHFPKHINIILIIYKSISFINLNLVMISSIHNSHISYI